MSYQLKNIQNYICARCGKEFQRNKTYVKHNLKKGMSGPYCSRKCVAKRGAKRVYGPILDHRIGRRYVRVLRSNGKREYTFYSRFLMEELLGRELNYNETVDHINRDKLDDRTENLRVVSRSQHTSDDVKRAKLIKLNCALCGKELFRKARDINKAHKAGWKGPFCGRSCTNTFYKLYRHRKANSLPEQNKVAHEYWQVVK
jgi:DNA-directed RNA polymerase subunit RPC12/RpoP